MSMVLVTQNQWEASDHQIELRAIIGLPSIAMGVDYEGTRNPLLEIGIRSLFDIPNGHDYFLTTTFLGNPLWDEGYRASIRELNSTIWGEHS